MKKQKPLLSLEPKDQTAFEEQIQSFKSRQRAKSGLVPGVIFIRHIPHGFYELEMEKYFSQFGKVLRVRLGRSKKTGGSKGFAFVEFECDEVAKIAADTMDNYLMFEKILKCEFIPPERVLPGFFRGWRLGEPLAYTVNREAQNKRKIRRIERGNWKRRLAKLERVKEKLSSMGIDFDPLVQLHVPEKTEVARKSPKMPLQSGENPFKEGTLLKGRSSLDKAIQVNIKIPFNDMDDGRVRRMSSVNPTSRHTEFYSAGKMPAWTNRDFKSSPKTPGVSFRGWNNNSEDRKSQDLKTSGTSEKPSFGKKQKSSQQRSITHFSDESSVQSSNYEMPKSVKRRSLDSAKKNASKPRQSDDRFLFGTGTPGKYMLATAHDVAIAARFNKNKPKSHNDSLKIDNLSSSQPSPFHSESNSTELLEDSARMKKGKKGKGSDVMKTSTPMSGVSDSSRDDSSRYTLEIDSSEIEITVRTPPKAIKKLKLKNKWQKKKKSLSFGKSSNFSVSEISQKSVNSSTGSNSGWKVSVK